MTGGVPTSAVTDIATTGHGHAADRRAGSQNLMQKYKFYVPATIPANAYKGHRRPDGQHRCGAGYAGLPARTWTPTWSTG